MQSRPHKTASFLSAHPVFTRAEFAAAFGHPTGAANVTSLLRHHLRAGNIKRVSREVFAAVPAHLAAERMVIDRFAAASKLRPDGVLGFHSALELHGIAYSEFSEVQLISAGRAELVDLPFGACRFIATPKALATAGKADDLTMSMDRQGVAIRVTAVERTLVDVLHRPELAGGVEEVLKSLDLVRYLDPVKVADYVELLDNRSLASVSGWWLETHRAALGVTDDVLARLRARLPRSKHYALGAEPGHAVLVEPWRVLLPAQAVDAAFEGVWFRDSTMSSEEDVGRRFLRGSIEPHAGMLNAPEPGQLLYKIMRPEDLIRSMALGYLHFNRVDSYRDFPGADAHDGEQLSGDTAGNAATKFEKASHFSAADYYALSRSRTYACCFSLENSAHIWREYAKGSPNGKVGLEFEFGKLRARLNETLHPDRCMLQAEGKPCLQIFSVNYGMVDYVDRTTHRENAERLPNPVRYAYLKDVGYAPERELRVSLSALGMGQFVLADGSPMAFNESLQVQFDFRAAFADGTIKQIMLAPDSNLGFLKAELAKLRITAVETPAPNEGPRIDHAGTSTE